jgi:transposase
LAPEIGVWGKPGPTGCGLDRANWTAAELATYLDQRQGIVVSERPMRTFCPKHGISPYRPTSQYLKGNPDPQAVARHDLEGFKKKPRSANSSC